MRTINPNDKKPAELTIEHIEANLQECMRRFDNAVNPTYEYHDFWDPLTHRIISYQQLSRREWWEEWKRAERMSPTILRHPFKRLGELRAGTDDHAFNEGAKVIEDVLTQVSLLRKVLELHKRAIGIGTTRTAKASTMGNNPEPEAKAAAPLTRQAMAAIPQDEELLGPDDEGEEQSDEQDEDLPGFDDEDEQPERESGLEGGSDDADM